MWNFTVSNGGRDRDFVDTLRPPEPHAFDAAMLAKSNHLSRFLEGETSIREAGKSDGRRFNENGGPLPKMMGNWKVLSPFPARETR